jgi:hypothetical protein
MGKHADPLVSAPAGVALAPLPQEEPEEVLVADPRELLSPSQRVDQKLLALLRSGNPGLYLQATGKSRDIRKIPPGPESDCPRFQDPDVTVE